MLFRTLLTRYWWPQIDVLINNNNRMFKKINIWIQERVKGHLWQIPLKEVMRWCLQQQLTLTVRWDEEVPDRDLRSGWHLHRTGRMNAGVRKIGLCKNGFHQGQEVRQFTNQEILGIHSPSEINIFMLKSTTKETIFSRKHSILPNMYLTHRHQLNV